MKNIKKMLNKIFGIMLALVLLVSNIPAVKAAGSVQLTITGSSTVSVGQKFDLTVSTGSVSSDDGKIYSLGGKFSYDHSILKINSCSVVSGSGVSAGSSNGDILGFYDGSYSVGTGANKGLIKCEFEGLANGTTTVTIQNPEVNDVATDVLTATVSGKSVTVGAATTSSTTTSTTTTTTTTTSSTTAPKSGNNNLASLGVSGYTMSPTFNASNTAYTVTVPAGATFVTVTGTKGHAGQTIAGLGNVNLTGNTTTHNVVVTAENGTAKTYTITINRQATTPTLDSDSTLKDLTVDGTTITGFAPGKTTYTLNVGDGVTNVSLAGIANSSKSTVAVTGGTNLKEGNNVAKVTVTAEDGSQSVYTINIVKPVKPTTSPTTGTTKKGETTITTKKKSSNTDVGTFTIGSSHTMEPEKFSNDIDVYDITVPYEVDKLDLTLALKDTKGSYKVSGNNNFQVGKVNVVTITITAEDGTTRTVILNVTRSTDVDGTKLTDINIGGGYTLSPKFDPDNIHYTVDVPGDVDKLDIDYKAPEGSKVEVYGNDNFKEGWNTVLIQVEDKNGYTRTYSVQVYKDSKKILGLTKEQFAIVAGIIGGLILTFLLILILLGRRRKKEDEKAPIEQAPIIDFKPEFNFGSRNGTDDDIVYPNAEFNQDSKVQKDVKVENGDEDVVAALNPTIEHKDTAIGMIPSREDREERKSIPYDPYDEIVTKDELIDAIEEGLATKNPEKLKILLEQEELNRKKEALRKKEESNK